ncbi:MAG: alpha/beta fold hydrolase [Clostridiales bacterium]|nr:alpha/beta fold hydrolase [Clostridiales bacterium]
MLKKNKMKRLLLISLCLMLISMVGASFVQTDKYSVTVKDLRFETSAGFTMSGLLFVPDGVSSENPAPGIVTSHGMFNNREMQDANFTELARRGYVVLAMDMPSHGHSEFVKSVDIVVTGMSHAVEMLAKLDYVDSSKIGVTGHSMGAMSANVAVAIDNHRPEPLISAVLLNSADAEYVDADGNYQNVYGTRDVGIIACQYDEFFMRDVDANGNVTPPRDYIKHKNAQSFLYFGNEPDMSNPRKAETIYKEEVDGEEAIRVIFNPEIIHPWSHFSKRSTAATVKFFEESLGAPKPISENNQVWQIKEFFNLVGLVGVVLFVISFTVLMVKTPFFAELSHNEIIGPRPIDKKGKKFLYGSLILGAAFGTISYFPLLGVCNSFTFTREIFQQSMMWGVSLWAFLCGLFSILSMLVCYNLYWKKENIDVNEFGIKLKGSKLLKTIILSLIVVVVTYSFVFFADYFFKTDFRIWTIAMKAFGSKIVFVSLFPYMIFFLTWYITSSVATNSFNFVQIGKKKWINILLLSIFSALPPLILLILQYGTFKVTGFMFLNAEPYNMVTTPLYPILVYLPLTTIISRAIYKRTNNPYLPGIINGLIITLISCSNSLTWL